MGLPDGRPPSAVRSRLSISTRKNRNSRVNSSPASDDAADMVSDRVPSSVAAAPSSTGAQTPSRVPWLVMRWYSTTMLVGRLHSKMSTIIVAYVALETPKDRKPRMLVCT